MATITKNFKIKQGLIVEGAEATVAGNDILTKKQADQDYIVGLIGGTATDQNTPSTIVKRDASGNFSAGSITANLTGNVTGDLTGDVTGDLNGNADTATALQTARTIELTGDITGSVSFDGTQNVQISTSLDADFATDAEVATAKGEAIDAAEAYTDTRETAITTAYQAYADQAEADAISTAAADATTKANNAKSGAEATAAAALASAVSDLEDYADAAEADAKAYTDTREGLITTAYQAYADQAESDAVTTANAYADQKVADLVDSAPALLDTLNELAAAIGDDANFATNLATSVGEKVAKAGDTMSGDLNMGSNKVTSLGAPTANGDAANKLYVDNAQSAAEDYADSLAPNYDAAGSAATAQSNAESFATTAANNAQSAAEDYADGLAVNYDSAGSASAAQTAAQSYADGLDSATNTRIDNLDTDDVVEGTNKYFTDQRAQDAVAADIASAISGVNSTIDALDTDDISEGSNLYFTNQRAIDAVGGNINDAIAAGNANASPTYQEINFTWATKQIGTYTFIANSGVSTVYTWNGNSFPAAKFLVRVREGQHSQVSEVLVTKDDTGNVAITEYAIVHTNGILGDVTAEFSNGSYSLKVNAQNNSTEVIVSGMLLAYGD